MLPTTGLVDFRVMRPILDRFLRVYWIICQRLCHIQFLVTVSVKLSVVLGLTMGFLPWTVHILWRSIVGSTTGASAGSINCLISILYVIVLPTGLRHLTEMQIAMLFLSVLQNLLGNRILALNAFFHEWGKFFHASRGEEKKYEVPCLETFLETPLDDEAGARDYSYFADIPYYGATDVQLRPQAGFTTFQDTSLYTT